MQQPSTSAAIPNHHPGVQCPWTASNCPLFNPIFSDEMINSRSPAPQPAPLGSPETEIKPSLLQHMPQPDYISPVVQESTGTAYTSYSYPGQAPYPTPPLASCASLTMPAPTSSPTTHRATDDPTSVSLSRSLNMLLNATAAEGGGPGRAETVGLSELMVTGAVNGFGYGVPEAHLAEAGPSSASRGRAVRNQGPGEGAMRASYAEGYDSGEEVHSGEGEGEDKHGEAEITPFISKLVHLLKHTEYAPYIRWNDGGDAFVFQHTSPHLLDIFTRFFRHSNIQSFVRQLNIYGFTRASTLALLAYIETPPAEVGAGAGLGGVASPSDYSAFSHPLFWRDDGEHGGRVCDLSLIKPKRKARKAGKASAKGAGGGGGGGSGGKARGVGGEGRKSGATPRR